MDKPMFGEKNLAMAGLKTHRLPINSWLLYRLSYRQTSQPWTRVPVELWDNRRESRVYWRQACL